MGALEELDDPGALQPEGELTEHPTQSQEELWTELDPPGRIVGPQKFRYTPIAQPKA